MTRVRRESRSGTSALALLIVALLLAGYVGAYYANLEGWLALEPGRPMPLYRICQEESNADFWPIAHLDAEIRR